MTEESPIPRVPSASYSVIIRTETDNRPGMLARVTTAIGAAGGDIGSIEIVSADRHRMMRDISVGARDEAHSADIVTHLEKLDGVSVRSVADKTFLAHAGGKIGVVSRIPLRTRDDLSMVYTPGVGRISLAIHADPARQWDLTIKRHAVAVVSDGTAVLGLGDIGPAAAQPVMEGKCMIFKEFAGIDAFPICLATQDTEEIVRAVQAIAPVFGAINLEDIAAPKCFEVEERLKRTLDIPVMHDDQHGTAVVALAALLNAFKLTGRKIETARIVVNGLGAAGIATARILLLAGARHVYACDRAGVLHAGRTERMNPVKERLAKDTNPESLRGDLTATLRGADVFIGLSGPGVTSREAIRAMAKDPIVFALANPTPEIAPEELADIARIVATGRSDYANQINNSLAYPGIFKGALSVQASEINEQMKLAAAHAIADLIGPDELSEENIVPSMFDKRVAEAVAAAVRRAAIETGVARRVDD